MDFAGASCVSASDVVMRAPYIRLGNTISRGPGSGASALMTRAPREPAMCKKGHTGLTAWLG